MQPSCPSVIVASALAALERVAADNTAAYARADPAVLDRARNSAANAIGRFDRDGAGDAEPQTVFHSSAVPSFGLARFVAPLRRCKDASAATGVGCLAAAATGDDDFESAAMMAVALVLRHGDATGLPLTSHMLHRLFLAALLVAAKAHHDVPPSTPGFARATGMDAAEMGRLEAALCVQLEWRIVVDRQQVASIITTLQSPALAPNAIASQASTPEAVAPMLPSRRTTFDSAALHHQTSDPFSHSTACDPPILDLPHAVSPDDAANALERLGFDSASSHGCISWADSVRHALLEEAEAAAQS
mmetsp:Transcript_18329/g.56884  ORF Transcript_18329/g.56884 Transcript_18329/m.56884 type:complete len:303 (-) Transcript_18329:746-1654(-)